jgi:DNA helicase HerA-like ATPase
MNPDCFKVISVAPNLIQIEIIDIDEFKKDNQVFALGTFLRIEDDKGISVIAIARSYRIKDPIIEPVDSEGTMPVPKAPSFIIDAQPLGFISEDGRFQRGGQQLTIPPTKVEIASSEYLKAIFAGVDANKQFCFGSLALDKSIAVPVDGNRFFGKHLAILGCTGSGKSCTVAKILQEATRPSKEQSADGTLNNSHIVVFDLHGEYGSAFPDSATRHVRRVGIGNLRLPYWLMNSEELEEFFLDTEAQDHNQRNIFKEAVILNKQLKNAGQVDNKHITYDSPLVFDIREVLEYIRNRNREKIDKKSGIITWSFQTQDEKGDDVTKSDRISADHATDLFKSTVEYSVEGKTTGTLNGKFINFVSRLENKISDARLQFLLGSDAMELKLGEVLRQFIGYEREDDPEAPKANITILDLSGIPFEVLSIVVSLLNRLIFDFAYYYKKIKGEGKEVPILVVLEEAHLYVPRSELAKYRSVRESIERIAKEGRKYGLSLMVVSQRPSDISETIFSQCNNFVVMRLTNPSDQLYVTRLLPDSVSAITENLPSLEQREALLIGDAVSIPTIVEIHEVTEKPDSGDIGVHEEWKKDWLDVAFESVVATITKEGQV